MQLLPQRSSQENNITTEKNIHALLFIFSFSLPDFQIAECVFCFYSMIFTIGLLWSHTSSQIEALVTCRIKPCPMPDTAHQRAISGPRSRSAIPLCQTKNKQKTGLLCSLLNYAADDDCNNVITKISMIATTTIIRIMKVLVFIIILK